MSNELTAVTTAATALARAEARAASARDTVYAAIVTALKAGRTVAEVTAAGPYSIAYVRAIARANGIPRGAVGRPRTSRPES